MNAIKRKKKGKNISLTQKRAHDFTGKIFYFPKLPANATLDHLTKRITASAHTMQQVNVEVPEVLRIPSCTIIFCTSSVHISLPSSLLQTLKKVVFITREKYFCKNINQKAGT